MDHFASENDAAERAADRVIAIWHRIVPDALKPHLGAALLFVVAWGVLLAAPTAHRFRKERF